MAQKYTLPKLPYELDALEPVISKEIMDLHYNKHHAAYVNNLNAALEKLEEADKKQALSDEVALLQAIKFNGGGHINHSIFWTNLASKSQGGGKAPEGALAEAINKKWGSLEKFIEQFSAKAVAQQGSGWTWLGYCPKNKTLCITNCDNQDPLSTKELVPLLGVDVWEHAYYLQYKNVRPEYVKSIWQVINWKNVEERFANAQKG